MGTKIQSSKGPCTPPVQLEDAAWHSRLSFGTYRQSGHNLEEQLKTAAQVGFTRFDTAQLYHNEATVGSVLCSLFNDDAYHITTKVQRNDYPHEARAKLRRSCSALGRSGQVLDRILLHRPMPCEQYRVLEEYVIATDTSDATDDALTPANESSSCLIIREIGVSNYSVRDMNILLSFARIKPCVNQVEFHPFVPGLRKLVSFCQKHDVPLQAHTVLAQGKFFSYPPLMDMARRKGATPAQVLLRFALDSGVDAVVQSSDATHLAELVEAAQAPWRLTEQELAEMYFWSHPTSGAPHVFYNSLGLVPPVAGVSTSTDVDEYVNSVADALLNDLRIINTREGSLAESLLELKTSDTVLSLPAGFSTRSIKTDPISLQIAAKMFPNAKDVLTTYIKSIKLLRGASMDKQRSIKATNKGKSCTIHKAASRSQPKGDIGLSRENAEYRASQEVAKPLAMPVQVAPREELSPFFQFLESSESTPLKASGMTFLRGTWFSDGRMDMCKQVVGSQHIGDLCAAVASAPPGKVRHFLLGNNVCCADDPEAGAAALSGLMTNKSQSIETWYLAGNSINGEAMGTIANALRNSTTAQALWLKRNPLHAVGASHLASLLQVNSTLKVLDLFNTGLFDEGVAALMKPLSYHKGKIGLRHLYLGANGITPKGAETIAKFLVMHPQALETLYLSLNPICSLGAVQIAKALVCAFENQGKAPALRRLSFSSCHLDDSALPSIATITRTCGLICLDLGINKATRDLGERGNAFTLAGVRMISSVIESNHTLRYLDVSYAVRHEHIEELRDIAR